MDEEDRGGVSFQNPGLRGRQHGCTSWGRGWRKHDTVGDGGMTNAVAEEPEEEESLKTQD